MIGPEKTSVHQYKCVVDDLIMSMSGEVAFLDTDRRNVIFIFPKL